MGKITLMALGAGFAAALSAGSASAMPAGSAPGAAPLVEHVADRCGPGYFRGPRGFCRPMGGPRFFAPGPRPGFYGRPAYRARPYGDRPYGDRPYRY